MLAILFEVLLIEIQEEIRHFAGWEGGRLRGTKIVNKHFVNKRAFPIFLHFQLLSCFPVWSGKQKAPIKSTQRTTNPSRLPFESKLLPAVLLLLRIIKCGPRGGTGGAKPGSGVQRFWGPLGASEFDPSFQ